MRFPTMRGALAAAAVSLLAACGRETAAPMPEPAIEEGSVDLGLAGDPGVRDTTMIVRHQMGQPGGHMGPGLYLPKVTCAVESGRTVCTTTQPDGLTITRSMAWLDAAGTSFPRPDSNSVAFDVAMAVKGLVTQHGIPFSDGTKGTMTASIDEKSATRTAGIGPAGDRLTVDGSRAGTIKRVTMHVSGWILRTDIAFSDTTSGLVLVKRTAPPAPGVAPEPVWPLSGTVVRRSVVTQSPDGRPSKTYTSREELTYNGTSKVSVVVTRDGVTKTCVRDLAARTETCQ